MPRFRHAVLGGTFDHFHVGHEALLERAFHVGRRVSVGVTTDRFLEEHPKPWPGRLEQYAARRRAVARWVRSHYPRRTVRVVPLVNVYGRSIEEGVDALVVSADTRAGGRAVNAERRRLGRRPIPLEIVPVVLADDLGPVSSRRIRAGEIDRRGHRLTSLTVGARVSDPRDLSDTRYGIRRAFPTAAIHASVIATGTDRPTARECARDLAREAVAGEDLGLGVARRPRGGWMIAERSSTIELAPRIVGRGARPELRAAVAALLRPDLSGRARRRVT